MYHISDLKKFLRCELLYYNSRDEKNVFKPFLRSDENINGLIKEYLGIVDCFEGVRNDGNDHFFSEIDDHEWFMHPRFEIDELRINVPIMHKTADGFDLGYIYYGNTIKDIDLFSYRITVQMLESLGLKVNEIYVIYFNEDYVRGDELDVQQLFVCVNEFRKKRIIDLVKQSKVDYQDIIRRMDSPESRDMKPVKSRNCRLNGICQYYDICFSDEKDLADDTILSLVSSQYKNDMFDEGIVHLKDVDVSRLEGSRVQYAQIMASKNNGIYVDRLALANWLDKISSRPISFIDFEWDRYLVPPYRNMRPLDVMCFEFALYHIDSDNHMHHHTFISKGDCRKQFIEALLENLPDSGPILAYNALGAETLRLKELSQMFPEYAIQLNVIKDRFVDLADPFTEGLVYDVRMQGNYSLKKIVDICSDYSYDDLDIDDGMEAVYSWRNLDKNDHDDKEILSNLEQYCSLDAYGLFLVYKWLIKLLIES